MKRLRSGGASSRIGSHAMPPDPMAMLLAAAAGGRSSSPVPLPPSPRPPSPHLLDYEKSFDDPELWAALEEGRRPDDAIASMGGSAINTNTNTPTQQRAGAGARWTAAEDAALRAAVAELGPKNWKQVAMRLESRSDVQCLHRWQKVLQPGLVKGHWAAAEDERLREVVGRLGTKDWSQVAAHLTGRMGKQVGWCVRGCLDDPWEGGWMPIYPRRLASS